MAEQHSEWCEDSRWAWAPVEGGVGHAPTEFWWSAQCFPQSLSLILKHVSHNAAHTVPSTRGPVCHIPPQILLISGLFKTVLKCYLHKPCPGPWPEEGSPHSLYVIRILCPPFAAFATVLFTITVLKLMSHPPLLRDCQLQISVCLSPGTLRCTQPRARHMVGF